MARLLIDYVHELGAKIGLSEEETERIWFDECDGDFDTYIHAMAVKYCAIIFSGQLQKWTPTKESLPKKEGDCLVQCKYLEMPFVAWFGIDPRYPRGNNNCVQKFWCDDCEDDLMPLDDVIAWMPLPKPYKENTE